MEYVEVGMHVPDFEGISWTPLPFGEYVADMNLYGRDLSRQVAVDVPRMRVTLQVRQGEPVIRVRTGEVIEGLLRRTLPPEKADATLAFLTQVSLAAPMRALANVLPPEIVVSEHDEPSDMHVALTVMDHDASIHVRKRLALRCTETLRARRDVTLLIEASTREEFVMVGVE